MTRQTRSSTQKRLAPLASPAVKDYRPETYGDRIAGVYDGLYEEVVAETDAAVDTLARLAGDGPVLELAIGTGRLALPLAARGIDIEGVDASEEMVAKLRDKPGGAAIAVTMGDFADVGVEGTFGLVYVAFNTFFALVTQEDQVRCFANVARHLAAGGRFAIEAFVPDATRWDGGQRTSTLAVELDRVDLEVARHDPVTQTIDAQHVRVGPAGIELYPFRLRYAYPSELDLMARLVRLTLQDRWGGWRGEPFTPASRRHVSVYG
jgi:SAM-dependent methyltransferase